jgi:hypothetical protein
MFKIKDWKFFERLIYWVIWVIILGSPLIFGDFSDLQQRHFIIKGWLRIIPFFIIFLVHNFYLLPTLFLKNKTRTYFISLAILILVVNYFFLYSNLLHELLEELTDMPQIWHGRGHGRMHGTEHGPGPGGRWMRDFFLPYLMYIYSIILSILIVGFNAALKYTSKWMRDEEKRKELEKENLQSKLSALQQQISPHFFMNTLNNIHALVDYNKEDAKEAIIRLSKMMRYLLYDSAKGTTTLQKEIEFLKSYIDLMKLRITDEIDLKISFPENPPDTAMAPFFFITFVENAFKYGISYREKSFVYIRMECKDEEVHFNIKNSIHSGSHEKTPHSGIGIKNTRKRLDLLFGTKYTLNIYDRENEFEVDLTIPTSELKS